MKVDKIIQNVRVRPTEKKIKEAKRMVQTVSGLPKEMPIEREYRIVSASEVFDRVKNRIQVSIDNMKK